jgi:FkbM family methyltransferase
MLVFDIGYNHGNFSKEILKLYPSAKIIGVEGHPAYEQLYHTNPDTRIEFVSGVVSDVQDTNISFFICDSNPGINSINPRWMNSIRHNHFFNLTKREMMVRSYTLDQLILKYGKPNIIKLDIEGAELSALRGLTNKSDILLFEWCEELFDDAVKCVERLQTLGYTVFANDHHWEGATDKVIEYNTNLQYYPWDMLKTQIDIDPHRKKRWGMIYAM